MTCTHILGFYHICGHTTGEIIHSNKCKDETAACKEPKAPVSIFQEISGAQPKQSKVCKETTSDLHYYISLCTPCTASQVRGFRILPGLRILGRRDVWRKMIDAQNRKRMEKMISSTTGHISPEKNEEGTGLLIPIDPSTMNASDLCSSCHGRLNKNQPMRLHCGHIYHLRCIKSSPFTLARGETICLVCLYTWDEMGMVNHQLWFREDNLTSGNIRFSYPINDLDRRVSGSVPQMVHELAKVVEASVACKSDASLSVYREARIVARMTANGEDHEIVVDTGASRDLVDKKWICQHPRVHVDRSQSVVIQALGTVMKLDGIAIFDMYIPGVVDGTNVLGKVEVYAWIVDSLKPLLLLGSQFSHPNQAVINYRDVTITLGACKDLVAPIRIRIKSDE